MSEEELKIKTKNGEVKKAEVPEKPSIADFQNNSPEEKASYEFSQYLVFLDAMKTVKKVVSVAPTSPPRNFFDQIQFYENAGTYRIYIYVSAAAGWRYVALT